jgi:hypothetical protein
MKRNRNRGYDCISVETVSEQHNTLPTENMYYIPGNKEYIFKIRVITKLPNSEQSYKGKVKTHNYINRQNQSTTGKL